MEIKQKLKAMRRQSRKIVIPKMRIVQDKTKYNRKKFKKGIDTDE